MKRFWVVFVGVILAVLFTIGIGESKQITEEQRKEIFESVLAGCNIFTSDEEFLKTFKRSDSLSNNIVLMNFCKTLNDNLPAFFGDIQTAFPQKDWGIPKGKTYTYGSFCITTERLFASLSLDDLRRVLFITLIEGRDIGMPKSASTLGRRFLLGWNMGAGMEYAKKSEKIDTMFLIKTDKRYNLDNKAKKERYRKLFASLLTSNDKEALSVIRSVSKEVLLDIEEGCKIVKEEYHAEFN